MNQKKSGSKTERNLILSVGKGKNIHGEKQKRRNKGGDREKIQRGSKNLQVVFTYILKEYLGMRGKQ